MRHNVLIEQAKECDKKQYFAIVDCALGCGLMPTVHCTFIPQVLPPDMLNVVVVLSSFPGREFYCRGLSAFYYH